MNGCCSKHEWPCRWPRNVSKSNLSGGTARGQGHYGKSLYTEAGVLMLWRLFSPANTDVHTLLETLRQFKCFTLHLHSNYTQAKFTEAPLLFLFSSTVVISPPLAGPLTAKILMHTLPRSVILRASAQVLCGCRFVNLSLRQQAGHCRLEQTWCSGLMERQRKLHSRVILYWLSIHQSGASFKGLGIQRDSQVVMTGNRSSSELYFILFF